jgi:hypothetical protein
VRGLVAQALGQPALLAGVGGDHQQVRPAVDLDPRQRRAGPEHAAVGAHHQRLLAGPAAAAAGLGHRLPDQQRVGEQRHQRRIDDRAQVLAGGLVGVDDAALAVGQQHQRRQQFVEHAEARLALAEARRHAPAQLQRAPLRVRHRQRQQCQQHADHGAGHGHQHGAPAGHGRAARPQAHFPGAAAEGDLAQLHRRIRRRLAGGEHGRLPRCRVDVADVQVHVVEDAAAQRVLQQRLQAHAHRQRAELAGAARVHAVRTRPARVHRQAQGDAHGLRLRRVLELQQRERRRHRRRVGVAGAVQRGQVQRLGADVDAAQPLVAGQRRHVGVAVHRAAARGRVGLAVGVGDGDEAGHLLVRAQVLLVLQEQVLVQAVVGQEHGLHRAQDVRGRLQRLDRPGRRGIGQRAVQRIGGGARLAPLAAGQLGGDQQADHQQHQRPRARGQQRARAIAGTRAGHRPLVVWHWHGLPRSRLPDGAACSGGAPPCRRPAASLQRRRPGNPTCPGACFGCHPCHAPPDGGPGPGAVRRKSRAGTAPVPWNANAATQRERSRCRGTGAGL